MLYIIHFSYARLTFRRFQTSSVNCNMGRIFSKICNSHVEDLSLTPLETLVELMRHRGCNLAELCIWEFFRMEFSSPAGGGGNRGDCILMREDDLGKSQIFSTNSQPKGGCLWAIILNLFWTCLLAVMLEERLCCAHSRSWTRVLNFWGLNSLCSCQMQDLGSKPYHVSLVSL